MPHRFSDEELSAFLDGELDEDQARLIRQEAHSNSALADDLDQFRRADEALRHRFDALLPHAPQPVLPANLSPSGAPARASRWTGFGVGVATGAAGAIAASLLLTLMPLKPKSPEWVEYVAAYQALYVPQTIAAEGLGAEAARRQIAALPALADLDLTALPSLPDMSLKRAQLLGFEGKPLIQIVFADKAGQPIAFCIFKSSAQGEASPMQADRLEGMESVYWRAGAHDFLLIGGDDPALLSEAAKVLKATI